MPPSSRRPYYTRRRLSWPLRAVAVLLLLTALVGPAAAPVAANPIEEAKKAIENAKNRIQQLTQQQEQTQQQREQKEAELQQLQREGESARDALQRVERELYAAIDRREAIQTKLNKIEVHIRDLEAQQEAHRAKLAERTAVYGQRLSAIYKLAQTPPLVLIFGATDLNDFLKRLNSFTVLAREDSRQVAAWRREHDQAEQIRQALDAEKAEQTKLRAEAAEVERVLDIKRDQQQRLIAQIEAEEARTQAELTEMDQHDRFLTEQIRHLEDDLPRLQEILARVREREEQRRRAAAALSEAERQLAPQPTGPFIWPVTGRITARFGVRTFAQRFHTGLDIAANLRVPVRAVATGHVLHVGYAVPGNRRASYGMYVTLLHGDGKVTLYAHLDDRVSPPQVEKGKIIDQGEVVGTIGMTGITSGPHLHFEVREPNGATRNPLEFLP